jgi:hypothetical protein
MHLAQEQALRAACPVCFACPGEFCPGPQPHSGGSRFARPNLKPSRGSVLRRLVLIVSLALLALPSGASAQKRVVVSPIALAQRAAVAYWGSAPCGGHITVRVQRPSPSYAAALVTLYGPAAEWPLAWSSWESPTGPNDKSANPSTYTDCVVTLNSAFWPSWAVDREYYAEFCTIMLHEYGNLRGLLELTSNTGNIMDLSLDANPPKVC